MKRVMTGLLVLVWMLLIGSFSAQTGNESGGLSTRVAQQVVTIEEQVKGQEYSAREKEARVEAMQFPIRKLAHMTEYALLALLLVWHLGYYPKLSFWLQQSPRRGFAKWRLLPAWGIAVLYAATDELHQLFVPGRSGQLTDVCIDGLGAFLGVLVVWLFWNIHMKIKNINKID